MPPITTPYLSLDISIKLICEQYQYHAQNTHLFRRFCAIIISVDTLECGLRWLGFTAAVCWFNLFHQLIISHNACYYPPIIIVGCVYFAENNNATQQTGQILVSYYNLSPFQTRLYLLWG